MARMRGPMPGSGDRWPQQQIVRPPHPGQVRPGRLRFCNTLTLLAVSKELTGNTAAFSRICTTANKVFGQKEDLWCGNIVCIGNSQ